MARTNEGTYELEYITTASRLTCCWFNSSTTGAMMPLPNYTAVTQHSHLGPGTLEVDIKILQPVSQFMDLTGVLLLCPTGFTEGVNTFMQIIEEIFR